MSCPSRQPSTTPEIAGALLYVEALIIDSHTEPVRVATMCLHCKKLPACKVEGPEGFTLCNRCYYEAGLDELDMPAPLPPLSAQSRIIAQQTAMIVALTAEIARLRRGIHAAQRIALGGE